MGKDRPGQRPPRPDIPRPFKLSGNATAWLESEIDTWILEKSRVRL
ncbi:AlpA family phage regulatory protein [Neisseria meningitidis]|nr:AlpA family phage regulatory protein [Neisseria meningitidis]